MIRYLFTVLALFGLVVNLTAFVLTVMTIVQLVVFGG